MNTLYEAVIERLDQNNLWQFPGGVHPPGQKERSNTQPIQRMSIPEVLYVPVKQHTGVEGDIIVTVGESVLKGQPLTRSSLPFAVPVHAPTSGKITEITPQPSAHPSGVPEMAITLVPDGNDTCAMLKPLSQYQQLPKSTVIEAICDAGISGLGGAGFPTHIKVSPTKPIDFLIINGIECEPYISSDDRLMREHAWQIRQGIDVLNYLIEPKCIIVAVEDNKPQAIEALTIACQDSEHYRVVSVPTVYPAGGEKQLVQVLTGREIPRKGLPADVGCVMFNVGTCYAIADAIFSGKPLTERVVTITGSAIEEPQNVWAMLGTPVLHLLTHAGYLPHKQQEQHVIMGGPMMGFTVTRLTVPVVKITNCLLVPAKNELPAPEDERACIRCGFCADVCPATLLPQQLYWYSKSKEYDNAEEYNLFDCIECGACAYVCPSEIPLVHYYRKAKADIRNLRDEKDKSDKAKARFEARKARLLAEKEAREEKHRLAAQARKQAMEKSDSGAKDKIAAALARAKAKKSQSTENSESPQSTAQEKKAQVQAAVARAKAKKAQTAQNETTSADKKAQVQAAVVRAKAKKAQTAQNETTSADKKPDADTASNNKTSGTQVQDQPEMSDAERQKREKIAQAIARAKARKLNQQNSSGDS
ncbi:electron transport complex subunit RsxC [Alteromonas oceanisediminis]|uniref:electron transport complex subunit RsxC n=1 Tax=Alteromonas oceanisediminis TaxID=2836180 RepID=UPI001BDB3DBF|nr:electron transport complex subunit RsxC [Alteromonas oceanisediminis]MBT0584806.1 electron transport complex subunit RsxC [Alteromonas oceanisediminis]